MKRNLIGIIVGIMLIIIGVYPVSAQQGTEKQRTVSPAQLDPTPQIETQIKSSNPVGIPSTLVAVQYRRCPMDGQRLKQAKSAVFEGKVYRFCCDTCLAKFWDNPQSVVQKFKNEKEVPLTITNKDGKCFCGEKASREYCRSYRDSITFFCSSACREKETKSHRTTVSREKNPELTGK
ncbi:MAG: hypothetical protein HQM08_26335 [Candidatus Riflebacteria bacterium]|nr:hypothetical protein [Candidatus Riflebacteria bacterium]